MYVLFNIMLLGYRERRRNIVVMASSQGLACPSTREVQPCPQPACHTWVEGHWSSCELDPNEKKCGEGRRTREVTCRSMYGVSKYVLSVLGSYATKNIGQ